MANRSAWTLLFLACTFTYGCYGPLVELSQVNGKVEYDTAQVVCLIESLKLAIAVTLLRASSGLQGFTLQEGLPYTLPALCYFLNGNISLHLLSHLDPATFSVLSNVKVIITTLLYIVFIRRYPSRLQVLALILLTSAGVIHSYGLSVVGGVNPTYREGEPMEMRASVYGVLLLLSSITLTSFASVYTEYVMKRGYMVSMHKQNVYLYSAGVALNALTALWRAYHMPPSEDIGRTWTPFQGFNIYVWTIILSTSVQGVCVAAIIKHSSNITKLVLTCASLVVSTLMSKLLFDLQINTYFLISTSMIMVGLVLYNIGSQANNDAQLSSAGSTNRQKNSV